MPSFGQLTLIILAGLAGPLLGASRTLSIPVVVGELLAGVALGKTGARLIKADNTTIAFLGNMGFAVLMMEAGMRVPLRNKALLGSLRRGAIGVVVSVAIGLGGGLLIAHALGFGHPAVWAVLLSTGSAAIVLPALEEAGVLLIARWLQRRDAIQMLRSDSAHRAWGLDLRAALVALFALCALAQTVGISIMIAGFAAGLIVAVEGGPRRLSDQVTGIGAGFLVPVFFVVLGASLNIRALVQSGRELELAAALIVGIGAVRTYSPAPSSARRCGRRWSSALSSACRSRSSSSGWRTA